ncbi:NAD(P)H-dependent oxidoreductase [Bacillus solimangrovi]|uniref:NAD(P)H oxidoreductase n=1 Tax=Bacillus solimangrovi TaxID=1305675 RepID=A0A1E5LAQ9_9BACI|nr:NAD(P)H-dependent oxidoreductase [Bacillus solimangrovi]OEH91141.1 NAD(P)H oxidoreductase [Bacillus solimangrovi]
MKTLVVIAHPNLETSVVNKRWVEELKKYPEQYTIHEIYKAYPDGKIDVEKEQKLIESHENLVFQFPVYWFNCPPLLKQWLDDVFAFGWAFGPEGDKLEGRKIALAVSAGIRNEDYSKSGRYQYTLDEVLVPFKTTALYCKADYRSFFAFYGAEYEPSESDIENSAHDYVKFLKEL